MTHDHSDHHSDHSVSLPMNAVINCAHQVVVLATKRFVLDEQDKLCLFFTYFQTTSESIDHRTR